MFCSPIACPFLRNVAAAVGMTDLDSFSHARPKTNVVGLDPVLMQPVATYPPTIESVAPAGWLLWAEWLGKIAAATVVTSRGCYQLDPEKSLLPWL